MKAMETSLLAFMNDQNTLITFLQRIRFEKSGSKLRYGNVNVTLEEAKKRLWSWD